MPKNTELRGNIAPDESVMAFSFRAERILAEAESLSVEVCGSYAEVNKWTAVAKQRSMTWVEGLYFSVDGMRDRLECDG
jgi:hypothetical protein